MAFKPETDGATPAIKAPGASKSPTVRVLGGRTLFKKANPGAPGKLGKSSTKAESLSKLRGKGALA